MFALVPLVVLISFTMLFMIQADLTEQSGKDAALAAFATAMQRYHMSALALSGENPTLEDLAVRPDRIYRFPANFRSAARTDAGGGRIVVTWAADEEEGEAGPAILTEADRRRLGIWARARNAGSGVVFDRLEAGRLDGMAVPADLATEIGEGAPVMMTVMEAPKDENPAGEDEPGDEEAEGK